METVDGVVVVGAGSVGLLTALKLGRAGIRVVVLEAQSGLPATAHVVACSPPIAAALDASGLLDDVRKRAVMCPGIAWRQGDGQLLATMAWDVLADDTDYPYLLLLAQNQLCSVLLDHLRALPNVQIRWNHRVDDIAQDAAHVTLHVSSPGGPVRLRSPWVAATDGAHSTVREKLGVEFAGRGWPERMVALDVFYDVSLHGYARVNLIHDSVDWAFIVQLDQSGLWRVCYEEHSSRPDEVLRRMPARLKRLLPGAPTPDQYRVAHIAPYQVSQRCVGEFHQGRVILAGDAAHCSNPMGGLGLSGGVLEAAELGEALIDLIQGQAVDRVLDEYSVKRRQAFQAFTSPTSGRSFPWMKERGPFQRVRDVAMIKKAGTDRAMMRQWLLEFERLNSRRSRSITSGAIALSRALKQQVNRIFRWLSRPAVALGFSIKFVGKRQARTVPLE